MKMETIENRIENALDTIRPYLQKDGGDVELVEVVDSVVNLRLLGACSSCEMSHMTMRAGIEEAIKKAVPEITSVTAVNAI